MPHLIIGDVSEREIALHLRDGASYKFDEHFADVPHELFIIQDTQCDTWICLPHFLAEVPGFDGASSYEQQLATLMEFFKYPDPPTENHLGQKPDDNLGAGSGVAMNTACAAPLTVLEQNQDVKEWVLTMATVLYSAPPYSCQNPVILVESGGIQWIPQDCRLKLKKNWNLVANTCVQTVVNTSMVYKLTFVVCH